MRGENIFSQVSKYLPTYLATLTSEMRARKQNVCYVTLVTYTIYLENGKDAHHSYIKWISVESAVDKNFLAAAMLV